ncbi:MAG: glucose-inhibited division protein A [Leptolyngbyaceae cyanobacterium CRU_2_3]|nr:glucose-inhibited division protein A [Leptolyngbyaceae cyanobacterium CRU_2_3]
MDRSKFVAIVTGAIALILSIAYLLIVQLLDFRGEMLPAPTELSSQILNIAPLHIT